MSTLIEKLIVVGIVGTLGVVGYQSCNGGFSIHAKVKSIQPLHQDGMGRDRYKVIADNATDVYTITVDPRMFCSSEGFTQQVHVGDDVYFPKTRQCGKSRCGVFNTWNHGTLGPCDFTVTQHNDGTESFKEYSR